MCSQLLGVSVFNVQPAPPSAAVTYGHLRTCFSCVCKPPMRFSTLSLYLVGHRSLLRRVRADSVGVVLFIPHRQFGALSITGSQMLSGVSSLAYISFVSRYRIFLLEYRSPHLHHCLGVTFTETGYRSVLIQVQSLSRSVSRSMNL